MTQPSDERPRRRYDSTRRRDRARATRAAITEAARELFLDHGWSGTTVRGVAERAGVGEATVYAAYGSKAGLAVALVESVELAAGIWDDLVVAVDAADGDPRAQLAVLVHSDRVLFERGGSLIAMLHDAARSDPELRAAYDQGRARAGDFQRSVFDRWPKRVFRRGVDARRAADVYAASCSILVYQVLTDERGWTPEQVGQWWTESLTTLLLAD